MRFARQSVDGPLVVAGHDRVSPPMPDQDLRFRNAFWLYLSQAGHDPISGRTRRYSQNEIARLFGVGQPTVCEGIASARQVREQIAEVAHV